MIFGELVQGKLVRANRIHGEFTSLHEGISAIREKYLELEQEIFKKDPKYTYLIDEVVQLGAMCHKLFDFIRSVEDE